MPYVSIFTAQSHKLNNISSENWNNPPRIWNCGHPQMLLCSFMFYLEIGNIFIFDSNLTEFFWYTSIINFGYKKYHTD